MNESHGEIAIVLCATCKRPMRLWICEMCGDRKTVVKILPKALTK